MGILAWTAIGLVGFIALAIGFLVLMGNHTPTPPRPAPEAALRPAAPVPAPKPPSYDSGTNEEETDVLFRQDDFPAFDHEGYRRSREAFLRLQTLLLGPTWDKAREELGLFLTDDINELFCLHEDAMYNLEYLEEEDPDVLQGDSSLDPEEEKRLWEDLLRHLDAEIDRACETGVSLCRMAEAVKDRADGPEYVLTLLKQAQQDTDEAHRRECDRMGNILNLCSPPS